MLRTRNNTDSNKLVIFFGIASYNGDNYGVPNMRVVAHITLTSCLLLAKFGDVLTIKVTAKF